MHRHLFVDPSPERQRGRARKKGRGGSLLLDGGTAGERRGQTTVMAPMSATRHANAEATERASTINQDPVLRRPVESGPLPRSECTMQPGQVEPLCGLLRTARRSDSRSRRSGRLHTCDQTLKRNLQRGASTCGNTVPAGASSTDPARCKVTQHPRPRHGIHPPPPVEGTLREALVGGG